MSTKELQFDWIRRSQSILWTELRIFRNDSHSLKQDKLLNLQWLHKNSCTTTNLKKIQLKRNKFSFPSQTSPGSYCNNLLFYQYDSSLPPVAAYCCCKLSPAAPGLMVGSKWLSLYSHCAGVTNSNKAQESSNEKFIRNSETHLKFLSWTTQA